MSGTFALIFTISCLLAFPLHPIIMEDNEPEDPWITMLRLEEEICEQEIRDFATRTPQPMSNDELLASLREGEERESWR